MKILLLFPLFLVACGSEQDFAPPKNLGTMPTPNAITCIEPTATPDSQ